MDAPPIRVVVADDHQMLVESLVLVLGREPDIVVVGTAGSVAEVGRVLKDVDPDVVLMDYRFPDGDGIEATQMVFEARPGAQVVMLTGMTDDNLLLASIQAGCAGFVTKDKAVDEVVHAVRAAYAGEAPVSSHTLDRLMAKLRRDATREPDPDLTARELEVLQLLASGSSNARIAESLEISVNTVRNHVQSILAKLGAHSKLEAVAAAVRRGVVVIPKPE